MKGLLQLVLSPRARLIPLLSVLLLQVAFAGPTSFTSDDFNARNLKRPLWTFTDPNVDATLRLLGTKTTDARLAITVPAGSVHDLWTNGYGVPRITQACTNTDFQVDVKFLSPMTGVSFQSYLAQGIVVEQDETNLLRFDFTTGHEVDSVKAFSAAFVGGFASPQIKINNKHFVGYGVSPTWLRVRRTGNTWKMFYSLNGSTYTLADSFVHVITVSKIGLFAGNAGPNPAAFTSEVDYFFNADSIANADDAVNVRDNIAPLIYNVTYNVKPNVMVVRWKTDEPADGTVEWGTTTAYGGTPVTHSGYFTDHRLIVSGLDPSTDYHFRVKGSDDSLNTGASGDYLVNSGAYIDDKSLLSDDFTGTSIDGSLWSSVNPRGDATFGINSKKLSIAVPGGVAHDIWSNGYNAPRLMQSVKNNANVYEFTVKFTSTFAGASGHIPIQGIVVEQDTNNVIRFNFSHDGTTLRVFVAGFYDGLSQPEVIANDAITAPTSPLWLRVAQGGGRFWTYYSINGTSWTLIPSFGHPMDVKKIGVFAGNGGATPQAFTCLAEYVATTLPAKPSLALPLNNAVDVPTPTTVQWDTTASAATYRLQLSTDAGFGTVAFNDSTITLTSKQVAGLLNTTKYYWRVQAKNTAGVGAMSDVFGFTTAIAAPAVPTALTPADNAVDIDLSTPLTWTLPPTATSYRLQVATDSTFVSGIVYNDSTLTTGSKVVPGLANLTKYYWRVNAKNAGGSSAYSVRRAFTTISAIPSAPVLVSPLNNLVNQQVNLTLRWNRSNAAVTYRLQVATDSSFASGIVVNDSTLTDTVKAMSGLANSTRYFWRVNAKNVAGTGVYSSTWAFTTIIANPNVPSLVSPADGAANQDLNVKFVWTRPAGATSFRLQAASDSTFASGVVVNDSTITDTSKTAGGFVFGVKYFWRVNAKNIGGASPYSAVFSFRTWDSDPSIPKPLTPANGVTGLETYVQITWTRPAGATSFHLQVATDSTFATGLVVNDPALADNFKNLSGLNYLTKYYWRVNADAVAGTSPYSPRWSFTTGIPIASYPSLIYPAPGQSVYPANLKLIWYKSVPAVDRYWVDVALDAAFSFALPPDSLVTDTTKTITGLENAKAYFWRVRAHNAGGWGPYSEIRTFTRDITDVSETRAIPKEFQLTQNYPNPFNPATQIEFGVPKEARVTLEVYNLLGQKVATLVDEMQTAGYHTVNFNASSLPSGLYLYRMQAGEQSFIRKMMLVK
jgi:hypothetical protein